MAITKETQIAKIEVVGKYKALQIATDTIIKEDDVEISRTRHRHALCLGTLDDSNNLVDTNISGEDAEVQAVANTVWTDSIKTAWKNKLIADKQEQEE